jgi:hypothetical protein
MAEVNAVPGSVIGVRLKDIDAVTPAVWLNCQVDATLELAVDTDQDDACKPSPADIVTVGDTPWATFTPSSRNWNISFSQKLMRESLAAANIDISDLIITGKIYVEVEFMTTPGQTKSDYDFVYSGTGILTGFTLNAPGTGASTSDSTIQGTGPITRTVTPRTS